MLFVLICYDRAGAQDVRMANRSAHLDFVAASNGKVKVGGPMLSDDGETMIGSILIIEADSLSEAQSWSALDPYARAGLFERVDIHPWKWVVGAPDTL